MLEISQVVLCKYGTLRNVVMRAARAKSRRKQGHAENIALLVLMTLICVRMSQSSCLAASQMCV